MSNEGGAKAPTPRIRHWARGVLRLELLAFTPALVLAGLWYGAEGVALVATTALAVAWLARDPTLRAAPAGGARDDPVTCCGATGLPLRPAAEALLDRALSLAATTGHGSAAFVLGFDNADDLATELGADAMGRLLRRCGDRLHGALRESDLAVRLDGPRFAVVLAPVRRTDLESAIQVANRLQTALEAPFSLDAAKAHVSVHIGFCLISRNPGHSGAAMLTAAETAAEEARRCGQGAIRAYSVEVRQAAETRSALVNAAAAALEAGQIVARFRPQLCTDTGAISGFAVEPCWHHPQRGVLEDADILHALTAQGLRPRLTELMLAQALAALRHWDQAGMGGATATVPLSTEELRDPKLTQRLKWDIDRFEAAPGRLRFELPETAVSGAGEDVIGYNMAALARMGCHIDLAGFGAGPASINKIRGGAVRRLRIDRSFVARADMDPGQQRVLSALISLTERLGVETLADGVSSIGEHAILAQLGCNHVQGPAIAPAMALEETHDWSLRHRAKLAATPRLGNRKV